MHVRVDGRGETVVLIHGLGASHRCFEELISTGKARYRFLAPDLPNSGQSKAWARMHPDELADAFSAHLRKQGVRSYRLFGHSFGALVAMRMAALDAGRVSRLVVASAPALGVPAEVRWLLANPALDLAMRWPMMWRASMRPFVQGYVTWLWGDPKRAQPRHLAHYLETMEADGFVASLVEGLRSAAEFKLPHAPLKALEPTILWGEKDKLVSPVQGEQLAAAVGGRLEVLPDVGHLVPEEAPAAVLAALDAKLR